MEILRHTILDIKKSNLRYLNLFLLIWVLITLVISIIDLVLFVMFILDYDTILAHSYEVSLNAIPSTQSILITAQNTAGMMASLALRGYILWIINLGFAIFLFTQTFKVYDYNETHALQKKGQDNNGFKSDNELQGHPIFNNRPISAFDAQTQ